MIFAPVLAVAKNDCTGPVTGLVADSNFSFTYESWRMHDVRNPNRPFYRFERCLYNEHERPLWFSWEKTGLENRIVQSGDSAVIFFDEERDDKEVADKNLWYGPAPFKIDATTVLRAKESALPRPRLWLAQDTPKRTAAEIFRDPENLIAELKNLGPEGILRSSGTKITVPASLEIGQRVRLENGDVSNADLLGVWIIFRERIFLGNTGPESKIEFVIDVAPDDYEEFVARGNEPPVLRVESKAEALYSRLPGFGSEIILSRDSPYFSAADSIRLVLAEQGSVPLRGSDGPVEDSIFVTFGETEVTATFPIMLARYGNVL